ncbi:MAG: VOC family protein [Deltaproteobacteria bacterium]|nr:VOC family protein [Deltaproteobacteria bacterium]
MINSKGIFHTHLVVKDLERSLRFYSGLFGMQDTGFKDGDLMFLQTPGGQDLLALNPHGVGGHPGGCAEEVIRERGLAGVQGGMSHFGVMLVSREDFEATISTAPEFGGRLVSRCEHGGAFLHAYIADPDGYVVEIHYEGSAGGR